MKQSLARLARANWRWERFPSLGVTSLISAAGTAMSFYNFNDETDLPQILQQMCEVEPLRQLVCTALTPTVTPYMLVLAQRAMQAGRAPAPPALDRYVRSAAFLAAFDSLEAAPPTAEQMMAAIERFRATSETRLPSFSYRVLRRRQAMKDLTDATSSWPGEKRQPFLELVALAGTAADHEESRHYWQGRTMRNLRLMIARAGLDLRTATLDQIAATSVGVAEC